MHRTQLSKSPYEFSNLRPFARPSPSFRTIQAPKGGRGGRPLYRRWRQQPMPGFQEVDCYAALINYARQRWKRRNGHRLA